MSFQEDQRPLRRALGLTAAGIIGFGLIANKIDNSTKTVADSVGTRETDVAGEPADVSNIPLEDRVIDPLNEADSGSEIDFRNEINYERLYEDLKRHESVRNTAYSDANGKSVGAGFNLERPDAREKIESFGLNYESVYNGRTTLNDNQINSLLKYGVEIAVDDARKYLGEAYWDNLDGDAKEILANMSYNLGRDRLSGFVKLKDALRKEDYKKAADEMVDSKWYNQTGDRAEELAKRMRSIK
ncbi:hypothetical protein CO038_00910 [Candidatus Pacearchaeota archaeon CG_4_9_14_0_2_um_filter_39_13]|nr:glycoside hydrolase family protein [Candidatus Pacearchaeota archaeon]OIO42939.1 MAG: hypothetical protein AUJ64_03135 [Candidatus Pacearchaeota archaeon CG1_02_39_14]PJC44995.1 MAG: hypothetical protein CO038_00910 [Candidatus Pacearchaeota archaeon CG_4_9_14_0_2_um_filter_39_13]